MTESIDIREALLNLFQDPDWVNKGLLGGLLSLVPVLNFAVIGYETRLARDVWRGETGPLPRLDDIGGLFNDGLQLALARLVFTLPVIALIMIPAFGLFLVPIVVLPFAGVADSDRLVSTVFTVGLVSGGLLCGVAMLLSFAMYFLWPAVTANYVRQRTFAACFNLREFARLIRENTGPYLLACLGMLGAALAVNMAMFLVYSVPCLGFVIGIIVAGFGVFYLLTVNGHVAGQLLALDDARHRAVLAATAA